jgi:hypothetical protein
MAVAKQIATEIRAQMGYEFQKLKKASIFSILNRIHFENWSFLE